MKLIGFLFALLIALSSAATLARDRPLVDEASTDRNDLPEAQLWQEGSTQLPPYPEDDDLLEFQVDDPQQRYHYFVDGRNLQVGADGVVRYTLVVRSPSGADNVSFEGLRCDAKEFKVYAYGGGRGKLKPLKAPIWEKVKQHGTYRYHWSLRNLYFCDPGSYQPYAVEKIVHLLDQPLRRADDLDGDNSFY